VQLGDQPSHPLHAGQYGEPERNRISFVADGTSMSVRVYDETGETDASCSFGQFAVVAD